MNATDRSVLSAVDLHKTDWVQSVRVHVGMLPKKGTENVSLSKKRQTQFILADR